VPEDGNSAFMNLKQKGAGKLINTLLFDLDGTLLPMDQDEFIKLYFKGLYVRFHDIYDFETLSKTIWAGTAAMVANSGELSNEDVFWQKAYETMGLVKAEVIDTFTDFYNKEFAIARGATEANPSITSCIHRLKEKGFTVVAATNPLFPRNATENRLRWAGFDPADFALITTYEDSHYCKPNLNYYTEILEKLGKKPEECLMAGNDNQEDMCAEALGIRGYLIDNCLINRNNAPVTCTWRGNWEAFIQWCDKHLLC